MTIGKRAFDVFWTLLGLAALWPLLLIVAVVMKVRDGGPVFFRQERVGYRGRPFRVWKFRSMVSDTASRGMSLTVGQDPRVTRLGVWLRRFKLDELPQLFNVLSGEMSLVGPRPEVPRYVARYSENERKVLELMPGITAKASIRYRHESAILARAPNPERTYVDVIMPDKIRMNLAYAARATVWTDLGVILTTLRQLVWPSQARQVALREPAPTNRARNEPVDNLEPSRLPERDARAPLRF